MLLPRISFHRRALILSVFLEVKQWMLLFSMSHRKSGQITKEFVTAFCESNFFQIISFGKFKKMVQAIAILKTKLFLFLVTTISFRN